MTSGGVLSTLSWYGLTPLSSSPLICYHPVTAESCTSVLSTWDAGLEWDMMKTLKGTCTAMAGSEGPPS